MFDGEQTDLFTREWPCAHVYAHMLNNVSGGSFRTPRAPIPSTCSMPSVKTNCDARSTAKPGRGLGADLEWYCDHCSDTCTQTTHPRQWDAGGLFDLDELGHRHLVGMHDVCDVSLRVYPRVSVAGCSTCSSLR